ncbi:AbrB family transcriptional regulator, partial [Escherichia sp. R-CC3]
MPVLQWGMLCVLSLLLSIGFLAVHLPAALLLGPMIAGIIFSMRGITLQLPRSAFLAAQAILGCMIAQNPLVLHNGYGIRDPQEYEPIPFKDICGSDVFPDDDVLVSA